MVPLAISRNALISLLLPILALVAGYLVYRDSIQKEEKTVSQDSSDSSLLDYSSRGSVPGLVALALAQDQAAQGFPTSIRIVPGCVALLVYLYFR